MSAASRSRPPEGGSTRPAARRHVVNVGGAGRRGSSVQLDPGAAAVVPVDSGGLRGCRPAPAGPLGSDVDGRAGPQPLGLRFMMPPQCADSRRWPRREIRTSAGGCSGWSAADVASSSSFRVSKGVDSVWGRRTARGRQKLRSSRAGPLR